MKWNTRCRSSLQYKRSISCAFCNIATANILLIHRISLCSILIPCVLCAVFLILCVTEFWLAPHGKLPRAAFLATTTLGAPKCTKKARNRSSFSLVSHFLFAGHASVSFAAFSMSSWSTMVDTEIFRHKEIYLCREARFFETTEEIVEPRKSDVEYRSICTGEYERLFEFDQCSSLVLH